MDIEEVDYQKYNEIICNPYHVFGAGTFSNLNKEKIEKVNYFLFKNTKYRLGIVLGETSAEEHLKSPFSAPFGGFDFVSPDIDLRDIELSIDLLQNWAASNYIKQIKITLPPTIYNESFISKQINVLLRKNFLIETVDLNYHFPLSFLDEHYFQKIWRNARKNLNRALSTPLIFFKCEDLLSKEKAYGIIKANREQRGFPLRMTWEQVVTTGNIIPIDFFIVQTQDKLDVAAAVIFQVTPKIRQVVYWGDIPEFHALKTMNYLAYSVFSFYKNTEVEYIDIGPSTELSIPNYGLCEFKESIGCEITTKLCFSFKV